MTLTSKFKGMDDQKDKVHLIKWLLIKFCLVSLLKEQSTETGSDSVEPEVQAGGTKYDDLPNTLPTITDIKRVIPKHCFEAKVSTSMFYVAVDVTAIICLYFAFEWMRSFLPWYSLVFAAPLYWLIQGTFFTAIFVLGHDCGHDSFSRYNFLNDTMGTLLHGFLMVPYYCWKLSHRIHHKNTGNIDKDEIFYPKRQKDDSGKGFYMPGFGLAIGWYGYMAVGYGARPVSHYNLFHSVFSRHTLACLISLTFIACWCAILYQWSLSVGWMPLFHHYLMPISVFGSWGVIFTFLHHTDENVPWFSDEKWEFVRGQLSSVDRDYGWAHDITHTIGTHQIHHLFTKVPHYHLREATVAFRKHFPELVRFSSQPIIPTFIKMFRKFVKQHVIGDNVEVHVYR